MIPFAIEEQNENAMMCCSYQEPNRMTGPASPVKCQSTTSKSIPRTASELQLCLEEQIADQRDYALYSRIVEGISRTRSECPSKELQLENHQCLYKVMQARNDAMPGNAAYWSLGGVDLTLPSDCPAISLEDEDREDDIFDLEL